MSREMILIPKGKYDMLRLREHLQVNSEAKTNSKSLDQNVKMVEHERERKLKLLMDLTAVTKQIGQNMSHYPVV